MPPTIRTEAERAQSHPARPTSAVFSSLQTITESVPSYPNFVPARTVHVEDEVETAPILQHPAQGAEEEDTAELQPDDLHVPQDDGHDEEAEAALFYEKRAEVSKPLDPRLAVLRSIEARKSQAQPSSRMRLGVKPVLKKRPVAKLSKRDGSIKEALQQGEEVNASVKGVNGGEMLCGYSSSEESDEGG